jgi:2-methylcitrate dehydratase PrpD
MFQEFHGTATCGAFGAAACARLLGLDQERTRNALGLARACEQSQHNENGGPVETYRAAVERSAYSVHRHRVGVRRFGGAHDRYEDPSACRSIPANPGILVQ